MGVVTAFAILVAIALVYAAARPRMIRAEPVAPDLPEARARAGTPRPDAET
jgi:hypothetical protein